MLFSFVYSRDIFCVERFPHKKTRLNCNGLLYVFPARNVVNFLINFAFLTAAYLWKAWYSLFVLKVPLNPNHSVDPLPYPSVPFLTILFLFPYKCAPFLGLEEHCGGAPVKVEFGAFFDIW